jgi:hypothetical protein
LNGPHIKLLQASEHRIDGSERLFIPPQWSMCMGMESLQQIPGGQGSAARAAPAIRFIPNRHTDTMMDILGVNRCIVEITNKSYLN